MLLFFGIVLLLLLYHIYPPLEQFERYPKIMAHKFEIKLDVKCPADKYYRFIKHNLMDLTKIHPEIYKSVEVIEGDGKSLDTVRLWKYVVGDELLFLKEKTTSIDDEKRSIVISVMEGDVKNHYDCFNIEIHVTPKGDGCVVGWAVEFDNVHDEVPTPYHYMDLFAKVCKGIGAHVVKE